MNRGKLFYSLKLKDNNKQKISKSHNLMIETFSVEAFIFVIILVLYVVTSHVIQFKKVPYLHESTMAIFMGILTAAFAKYALGQAIQFNNQIFFAIILPPIIFSAGYSLRKSLFFENFGMVAFLGIIGTIIGFICLTGFIIFINNIIFQSLTLTECLMISSVLCATDTVAAMSLIKPEKYPVLNAVLFGQGIINDAVAIILFGTISNLKLDETGGQFTFKVVAKMFFDFCYLFFFSMAFGIFTGFGLSYLFKIYQSFNRYPIKQTSLILLNGYFTYLLGELIGLSGIITLFTCAIIMGHYCFMNISEQSQKGTGLAFQTVSYISEAFVFAYLGASILSIESQWSAIAMGFIILASLPFIRAIMVYALPLVYKILGRNFPMDSKQIKICWYSGMVRGVIAFALCLQIESKNQKFITTVALVIVLTTTIIGSSFLQTFAKAIGVKQHVEVKSSLLDEMRTKQKNLNTEINSQRMPSSGYKNIFSQLQYTQKMASEAEQQQQIKQSSKGSRFLSKLQNKYIKPIFQKKQQQPRYDLPFDYKQPQQNMQSNGKMHEKDQN